MPDRLSKDAEDFISAHSSLGRIDPELAKEAARQQEEQLAAEMRARAENPLDLSDVPHAEAVLEKLGAERLHPLLLNDFFTLPREYFVMDGERLSVREWLLRGGDPAPVLQYAEHYLFVM